MKNINSLDRALAIFEEFYRYAGLRLNYTKTEVLWLGGNTRRGTVCGLNLITEPTKVLGVILCKNSDETISINVNSRIQKLQILLNLWKQRSLSIKGRITIVKTQALPLILFIGGFIYMPSDKLDEIQKILYDFVWPKGKHHVKNLTLIEDIRSGGLKMPDIHCMIKALKLTWLKRMTKHNNNVNATAKHILKTDDIENLLISKNHVKYLGKIPKFYVQLLSLWHSLHNTEPLTTSDVLEEIIWDNEKILVGNKPLRNINWLKAGVCKIKDIVDDQCILYSKNTLKQIFKVKCEDMYYNSLIAAIPKQWLNKIKLKTLKEIIRPTGPHLTILINKKLVKIDELKCSDIYWSEVHKKSERPTSYEKWETEYYYINFDWEHINQTPYNCARETSLQSLQYQIINRYFPCGEMLHIWKIKPNNLCDTCQKFDTLQHYFVDCPKVKLFWNCLKTWFKYNFDFVINFGPLDILFGIPNYLKNLELDVFNFIILYAKMYIKQCKENKKATEFYEFQIDLKERILIEQQILYSNGKKNLFDQKWNKLLENL